MSSQIIASSTETPALGADYGDDYLNWKSWGSHTFGVLTKTDKSHFRAEIKRTRATFPKHSNVLEIGFGNGNFLEFACQQEWNIVGTEVNAALVDTAKLRGFNAVHASNMADFQDESFELIVAFDVLEHIAQDAIPHFLLEVRRTLKPGGTFVARFPNGDSPFGLINQNADVTHLTAIGRGKARYFARKAEMELVFIGGEAEPIWGASGRDMTLRAIGNPIKKAVDACLSVLIYQSRVAFCSRNLTLICRKQGARSH